MQYKIIADYIYERLSQEVSRHLAEGWELWGSPFFAGDEVRGEYGDKYGVIAQAVVRPAVTGSVGNSDGETKTETTAGIGEAIPCVGSKAPQARGEEPQGVGSVDRTT